MSHHPENGNKILYAVQEFSLPLLIGVVVAIFCANLNKPLYDKIVHGELPFFTLDESHGHDEHGDEHKDHDEGHDEAHHDEKHSDGDHKDEHAEANTHAEGDDHGGGHGHSIFTLHFIINDLFMVLFFGIAAKEIAEACLPGGALNPVSKAINPLLGTIGGVVGPVGVYFLLNAMMGYPEWARGWGIPTATDIALAWLIARLVFGNGHPAISFLLLLAVADDGIGLMIIAIFYPTQDPVWLNTLWVVPGMVIAYLLRMKNVQNWVPYIVVGGAFSWWGLYSAHLHPALALVPIVPFLPGPEYDEGLFRDDTSTIETDPLNNFEHALKPIVDFGLFFFAFANAGVQFSSMNNLTWIVLLSLLVGKTVGITFFSWVGVLVGFPLPDGMKVKHLVVAGVVAGLGLTVALFVAGQAFTDDGLQGSAKMGALFSGGIAVIALVLGSVLGVKDGAGEKGKEANAH